MRIWLDAQLSPLVASWLDRTFADLDGVLAVQADTETRSLDDSEIFRRAGEDAAVVMTKDRDFVDMLERVGPPPQVIWLTCGNTSNRVLRAELLGLEVSLANLEDVILAKLEWAKMGGSELQRTDVVRLLERAGDRLDQEYVEAWVSELDLKPEWDAVLDRLGDT